MTNAGLKSSPRPLLLQKLVTVSMILVMALAFFAAVQPVFAADPTASSLAANTVCSACSSKTQAVTLAVGTTVVVEMIVTDATATVSSVTDTAGLTYQAAETDTMSLSTGVTSNGVNPTVTMWYAKDPSTAGADTITITLTGTATRLAAHVSQISSQMTPTGVSSFNNGPAPSTTCSSCTFTQTSATLSISAGSIVMGIISGTSCPNAACNSGATSGGPILSPSWGSFTNVLTGWGASGSNAQFSAGDTGYAFFASTTTQSFTVSSSNNANEFVGFGFMVVVFNPSGTISSTTQTQTIGSCPTKNTATFTMANSTTYYYEGVSLGQASTGQASVAVAAVTGSAARTLTIALYAGTAGQAVSANYPLILQQSLLKQFSAGASVNTVVNWQTATSLAFNQPFAIAISGMDKIKINQSSLSGLLSVSGSVPSTITSLSANGNDLYLCLSASYQSSVTTTAYATTTQLATSTAIVTSTVNTIGASLFTTASNWPVIFFILFLPAGLLLGATRTLIGAILGLMIGAVIGVMMGILPAWLFIGLVIATISIAFVTRERG